MGVLPLQMTFHSGKVSHFNVGAIRLDEVTVASANYFGVAVCVYVRKSQSVSDFMGAGNERG